MTPHTFFPAEDTSLRPTAVGHPAILAGFRLRSLALGLDLVLLFAGVLAAHFLAALLCPEPVGSALERPGPPTSLWLWLGMAGGLSAVYAFVFEWWLSASPGKLLCGLRVKSLHGDRCGFNGALVRTLFRPLDLLLSPMLLLTTSGRQRIGDRMAGTAVVLLPRPETGPRWWPRRLLRLRA
jgi:uncharacterized RDD family membrane protein YckC